MSITLHMVASLDGYIAKENNDVSWMDTSWCVYDKGEEFNMDILKTIECYIMGSRTYEHALKLPGWPYGDTRTIVITSRKLTAIKGSVEFYSGDLHALTQTLERKNVWLVGGPNLYHEFFRLSLVDKICLTVAPIILGHGVPFFRGNEQKLLLKEMTAFKNGMIDLWYGVVRTTDP